MLLKCLLESDRILLMKIVRLHGCVGVIGQGVLRRRLEGGRHSGARVHLLIRLPRRRIIHSETKRRTLPKWHDLTLQFFLAPNGIVIYFVVVIMTIIKRLRLERYAFLATAGEVGQHLRLLHISLCQIFRKLIECNKPLTPGIIINLQKLICPHRKLFKFYRRQVRLISIGN